MKIKGIRFTVRKIAALALYYGFAQYLPAGDIIFLGGVNVFVIN